MPNPEIKVRQTEQGFDIVEFEDSKGVACSLQKSSLATEDFVWVGCNEIGLKKFTQGKGWEDIPLEHNSLGVTHIANTRMHLSRDQVKALIPYLTRFVETGDLGPVALPALPESLLPSYQTDTMMFAMIDGQPVACGWKQEGPKGVLWTEETIAEWSARGFDIRLLHKDDPEAKVLHDAVWDALGRRGTRDFLDD